MKYISCFVIAKFVFLTLFFTLSISAKNQTVAVTDDIIYAQVFNQISGFYRQTEIFENESEKNAFRNYFKREADLTEHQSQLLRAVAESFTNAPASLLAEEKLKLALHCRENLRNLFGERDFVRFDKFVKKKIAPTIKVVKSADFLSVFNSTIFLDESEHKLYGGSSTEILTLSPNANAVFSCSVSSTMSGPGVSESGSQTNDPCERNPSVGFTSMAYQSNSQYCVTGSHAYSGNSGSSSACLTVPDPPIVKEVTYEQIDTTDLAFDTNPNAQGGLRLFADKKTPTETVDRRKIRVKAKYSQTTAGVRIYFRSYDLDDPSANAAPIDSETTANDGNDNNGNVDGTPNTKAGLLSIPNPNPNNCQAYTHGVSCETDATGTATVEFTTTRQPGDNFTVAASADDTYIGALVFDTDGINLKDGNNVRIPATKTSLTTNDCLNRTYKACRTDMLTVWRRLHIEMDSMGNVGTSNRTTVTVNGTVTIPRMLLNPGTGTVNITNTLGVEAYKYGRLIVEEESLIVTSNAANSLQVLNTSNRAITINDSTNLILYDDDDYNDNDTNIYSGNINPATYFPDGDENESIVRFGLENPVRLPNSLIYLTTEDGNYPDNKPKICLQLHT